MSRNMSCTDSKYMATNDLKSALEKCKNDPACKAVKDIQCKGTGPFYNCKDFDNYATGVCVYEKGKKFVYHIYKLKRNLKNKW